MPKFLPGNWVAYKDDEDDTWSIYSGNEGDWVAHALCINCEPTINAANARLIAAAPAMYEALKELKDILNDRRIDGMYLTIKAQEIIANALHLADGEGVDDA